MNNLESCKFCTQPRHPRRDRPGKFFTMCHEHYKEYQRKKNKESYDKHSDQRRIDARNYYWSNPEKARAAVTKCMEDPERHARKKAYMRLYNSPYRIHCKNSCEICGYETRDPELKRDLDVHHLDGNHQNNRPSNLQTLCPPCHRLL